MTWFLDTVEAGVQLVSSGFAVRKALDIRPAPINVAAHGRSALVGHDDLQAQVLADWAAGVERGDAVVPLFRCAYPGLGLKRACAGRDQVPEAWLVLGWIGLDRIPGGPMLTG